MIAVRRAGGLIAGLVLTLGLCFGAAAARAAPTFPAFTGRVVDQAHVLSPQVTAQLDAELGDLQTKTSRQLVVVTLSSLQGYDIADYGYQLGRAWGVGQKGLNNGVLFIVAPSEHKVRIEVGYGLEPIVTDALSSAILQERVIPRFRAGDVQGGIVNGTQALVQQLGLDTSTAEAKAAQAGQAARTPSASARIGNNPLAILVLGFILFWAIGAVLGGGRAGGRGGMGWIFPLLFLGGLGGGGGYRDDDFGGGGFGGGGGFSGGGGGSFGGGGSSGELVMLSKADHDAIAAAVARAEAATSGEILCVVARKVSNYRETPLAWGAAAALLLPPILVALGVRLTFGSDSAWDFALVGTNEAVRLALGGYALIQGAIFVLVALVIAAFRPVKLALTPAILKHRRVRQAAVAQAMAARLLGSEIGATVVIFASMEDRMVAVVGDEAIHAKVGDEAWDKAVAVVQAGVRRGQPAAGFVEAVELCGALMARHFPSDGGAHRLVDGLLEV